jgi:ferredoxin--NADP+ reductase
VIDTAPGAAVAAAYVAGWIKRGPTGFIGTNKSCAMQTVSSLVDDFNAGLLADPLARPAALDKLIRSRRPDVVDAAGWRAIDAAETARGDAEGRPRVKFTDVADMVAAAATAPELPVAKRLLAGLFR